MKKNTKKNSQTLSVRIKCHGADLVEEVQRDERAVPPRAGQELARHRDSERQVAPDREARGCAEEAVPEALSELWMV